MSIIVDKPHNMLWDDARFHTNRKPSSIPTLTSDEYVHLIRNHYRHDQVPDTH